MDKRTSLIAACCLSVMALPLGAAACDKEKTASCESKPATAEVVAFGSNCSQGGGKVVLSVGSEGASCGGAAKDAKTVAVGSGACDTACPSERMATLLVRAIERMDKQCGTSCGARADVLTALQTMAKVKPGVVCEEKLASLAGTGTTKVASGELTTYEAARAGVLATLAKNRTAGSSTCSSGAKQVLAGATTCDSTAKAKQVVAGAATCDSTAKAKQVAAGAATCDSTAKAKQVVAGAATCDSTAKAKQVVAGAATCDSTAKAKQVVAGAATCDSTAKAKLVASGSATCDSTAKAKLVASGSATCDSAAKARYVAYGCEKTDRVARAAARAYLALMREIKLYAGADGCAAKTASQVLAAVLEDLQNEASTQTAQATEGAAVAEISFGAVGDEKACDGGSRPACCAEKK